ncbi:MAG: hypothetical protein P8X69_08635 [Maritimibacter sp.]
MSHRPDIAAQLAEGEELVWQGHPKPGRKSSGQAKITGAVLSLASLVLFAGAVALALFKGHLPVWTLTAYLIVATAAFLAFVALRVTVLATRQARARDARTSYGITDRRALTLSGRYAAELPLAAEMGAEIIGDRLIITSGADSLRFDRLDDAPAARDMLMRQIEGGS